MTADLHIHTNRSDGQHPPRKVVEMAAERGLKLISVTDHDTLSGIPESMAAANDCGLAFIPGIEINSHSAFELHILGYGFNVDDPLLNKLTAGFSSDRDERAKRIFNYLEKRGIMLRYEDLAVYNGDGAISRAHFARAMVDLGYVSSVSEAFERHLTVREFYDIERPKPYPSEVIYTINRAGGVAVLAHPIKTCLKEPDLETLIKQLVFEGLGGIECYYPSQDRAFTEYCLFLAGKYGLIPTGGSDFHGESVRPGVTLGAPFFDPAPFLEYLRTVREESLI